MAEEQDGERIEYRYDEAGRPEGTTTPDGETQREYDASGILTGYRSNGHWMDFGLTPAGLEKNRRYRPEDEARWLGQTQLNHAVYMQEQGYDACGRTAWQNRAQNGWQAATRAWRRGDRWVNTVTRAMN
ncbi:hypothetical protein [Citrobacter amalonaticus]|uniref:hypothetical protein n=1 Tax=Citrobacter amalonaticus TaxID=35703 RepID=UPI00300C7BC7